MNEPAVRWGNEFSELSIVGMPPNREEFQAQIDRERAMFAVPCQRIFMFHPEDNDLYAPLIALAEDDFREHRDVLVSVYVDPRCERVEREGS